MAQRPHTSSVSIGKRKPKTGSKGRGRKWTYSIGDFDRVDLLCSPLRVQRWALLEKLMEDRRKVLERSQIKGRLGVFREMMTQMGMRLDY